jgi:hypothetical protein
MPPPNVPTKTVLGQEELRRRSSGLGQRHRTLLFLIDGRRPLAEVLSLAKQAGAATSHFEDLLRLGFVEMPPEPPAPSLSESAAMPLYGEISHLEVEVPADSALPGEVDRDLELDEREERDIVVPTPVVLRIDPDAPAALPVTRVVPPMAAVPLAELPTAPPAAPAAPTAAPPTLPASAAPTTRSRPTKAVVPAPRVPTPPGDLPLLEQVRTQLLETLRYDSQPSGARIAERARQAQMLGELIEVVWIMERGLRHAQRSHRGLTALQRARELLGLGNTLVDEESRPPHLDDDDWWTGR